MCPWKRGDRPQRCTWRNEHLAHSTIATFLEARVVRLVATAGSVEWLVLKSTTAAHIHVSVVGLDSAARAVEGLVHNSPTAAHVDRRVVGLVAADRPPRVRQS